MVQLTVLTDAELEAIHQATLQILNEVGIVLTHPEARDILTGSGATVRGGKTVVLVATNAPSTPPFLHWQERTNSPVRAVQFSHKTLEPPSRGRPMQRFAVSGEGFRPQNAPGTGAESTGKLELNSPDSPVLANWGQA